MRVVVSFVAAVFLAAITTSSLATDPVPGVEIYLGQDPAVQHSENVPVDLDWEPQGTNYNSSRSNRGKRPSIGANVVGIIGGEGVRFLDGALELSESEEGASASVPFTLPVECGDECHFNIRLVRLDRALEALAPQLEERTIPAETVMVIHVTVGDRTMESVVPAHRLFADDTYLTANRFVLRRFDGREGMRGEVEVFFALLETREDAAARGRGE